MDLRRARAESRSQAQAAEEFQQIDYGKLMPCPICGKEFHEDVLERHASECTDFPTNDEPLQQQAESRTTRNRQVFTHATRLAICVEIG